MYHLRDLPAATRNGPLPMDGLLPAAVTMSGLCVMLFSLLFVL